MIHVVFLLLFSSWCLAELEHTSEVSTVTSGGNSEVETYVFTTANHYKYGIRLIEFGGHYTYGEAQDVVTARKWDIHLSYEQLLSPMLAFTFGEVVEGYAFQGIKARYNSDAGFKYYYIKSDIENLFTELGYRYTVENRYVTEDQYENKARFYNELNQEISKTFQYRLWFEYIHNFTNTLDYLVTYEASVTSVINSMLSLKLAYRSIYDKAPALPTYEKYDYTYTTSIVAKF